MGGLGLGFGVVRVNLVDPENSKKTANTDSDTKSSGSLAPVANQWPFPGESVIQVRMTDSWETIDGKPPALLDRFYGKPTPGNGWFRLEDISPLPIQKHEEVCLQASLVVSAVKMSRHP